MPNVVFYRSGGGKIIPWCPEVVLYLIQPGENLRWSQNFVNLEYPHLTILQHITSATSDPIGMCCLKSWQMNNDNPSMVE